MYKSYSKKIMIYVSIILLGIGIIMLTEKNSSNTQGIFLIIISIIIIILGIKQKN